jgi:hypothetical protein
MTPSAASAALRVSLFLGLLACSSSGNDGWVVLTPSSQQNTGEPVRLTGVIRHLTVEGGVYVIRSDDGVTYNPINLPEGFRQDGLAVEVEGRRRDDMGGIHQVGPLLELDRIRRREGGGTALATIRSWIAPDR